MKPLSLLNPYLWAVSLRNFLHDLGLLRIKRLPLPVISVGNLSCGGTGKTTLTRFLAEKLSQHYRVGILLRGYKRSSSGYREVFSEGKLKASLREAGDEAYLLGFVLKGHAQIVISVCEDRYFGGKKLFEEHHIELLLLDDAFQHRRLYRDLDLVLLKKADLKDRLLPFGRLREPLSSLKRAHAIVLTYQEVEPFDFAFEDKPVFKLYRKEWKICRASGKDFEPSGEIKFIAFSGLGYNRQFLQVLKDLKIPLEKFLALPDHYDYRHFTLDPQKYYLTTLKDYLKLPPVENLFYLDFKVDVPGLVDFIRLHLTGVTNSCKGIKIG